MWISFGRRQFLQLKLTSKFIRVKGSPVNKILMSSTFNCMKKDGVHQWGLGVSQKSEKVSEEKGVDH